MRKIARLVLIAILVGLVLLLAFNLLLPHAKEIPFFRLTDGQNRYVYMLGAIHGAHLEAEWYSLLHLQALIENLSPDLLLVESRPEELTKDNWGDGPIEMPFASLTARSLDIEVQGIDWWTEESLHGDDTEREDRMFQNILQHLSGHQAVLILTGWSHVGGFKQRLQSAGYKITPFTSAEKQTLFDTSGKVLSFPPGMTFYIQKRIEGDQITLQSETDSEWIARDREWNCTAPRTTGYDRGGG